MSVTYRIIITASRDDLDPYRLVPDDHWDDAFRKYQRIMSDAVSAMFPDAEVEVREGAVEDRSGHNLNYDGQTLHGPIQIDRDIDELEKRIKRMMEES